jgi:hypothetical protein
MRIMAAMSQLPHCESNKQRKITLVRSETWRSSAEFLEFALRDELKETYPARLKGRQPVTAD